MTALPAFALGLALLASDADTAELVKHLGADALPPLRQAGRGAADPDVRLRALVLIRAIERKRLGESRRFDVGKEIVWAVAVTPDGRFALTGGGDKQEGGAWKTGTELDV